MPIIRPISDLRNKSNEIDDICLQEDQPVFITKNGIGHLVVMSQTLYEQQQALLEIYDKLGQAEGEKSSHTPVKFHPDFMAELRDMIHG